MSDLTPAQTRLLRKLAKGHCIAYSRDGDNGWLSGTNVILDDKDIWALRDRQYIIQESDEREDDYGCDKISSAGRDAVALQDRASE
jgi:hypothetical protein